MENFIFKDGIPWWYFIIMIALFALNIFLYHEIIYEGKNSKRQISRKLF